MDSDPSGFFNEVLEELMRQLAGREPSAEELQEVLNVSLKDAKLILKQYRETMPEKVEKPAKKAKTAVTPAAPVDPTAEETQPQESLPPGDETAAAATPESWAGVPRTPWYDGCYAQEALEVPDSPPLPEEAVPTTVKKDPSKKEEEPVEDPNVKRALSLSQAAEQACQFTLERHY